MDTEFTSLAAELEGIPLLRLEEDGTAPKERLKSPSVLRGIYTRLKEEDELNAHNRALAQGLLDGDPPYDCSETEDQPDMTNINWQGAEETLEKAKTPYYKLINGSDDLLSVKTRFGPADARAEWETIMSNKISDMIREWADFSYQMDLLTNKHVWEGIGILHWPTPIDWRASCGGLGQFYFARQSVPSEARQEIVCVYEEYTVTRLYDYIKDPEKAKRNGWDVDAVRYAIREASSDDPLWDDWEKLMKEVKNNDFSTGSKTPKVYIVHGFVQEFGGKVGHYMTTVTQCSKEGEEDNFLFKKAEVYASMSEAMVFFPYSMGTNNTIHGIRGLGYKIFPIEQQRNRSACRLIDKGMEGSATFLESESETELSNIGLQYIGNRAVLTPGVKLLSPQLPDLQRSVMPALELMDQLRSKRTAGYTSDNVFQGDQRKTKAEVVAHLEQSASLNDASMDFFYMPLRRYYQQTVRRITNRNYTKKDPGYDAIEDLLRELDEAGVPREAFYQINIKKVREVRVIGGGSAAAKSVALERLSALYPRMDDVGKNNYNRDVAVDIVGQANASRYFPPNQEFRTTDDTQIAILQNFALIAQQEVPVLSSDMHLAHAREHIKPLVDMYQQAEAGQMDLAQAATQYIRLYQHTVEHVEAIEGDEASIEEANAMRQMLQRIGEVISNGAKEAQAQAQEAEEEAAIAQQEGSFAEGEALGKARAEVERLREKSRVESEIKRESAQVEREIKLQAAQDDRAIKDMDAAAKMQREAKAHRVKQATQSSKSTAKSSGKQRPKS